MNIRKELEPARRGNVESQEQIAWCYHIGKGVKRRKTVRGNTIAEDIVQINTVVVSAGSKPIAEILGADEEEEE